MKDNIGMIKGPNQFVTARAALERAANEIGDPDKFGDLRNAIISLFRVISGVFPQIEKDLARKLLLTYRNKIRSEVKTLIASFHSCEPRSLEHWHQVMELFADSSLPDDPEFHACSEQLRTIRAVRGVDTFKAEHVDIVEIEQRGAGRRNDFYSRIIKEVRSMSHTSALRAIGPSLEAFRLRDFRLAKQGHFFIVRSESLRETHEWILRNHLPEKSDGLPGRDEKSTQLVIGEGWLCYGPVDIARLNARQRSKAANDDGTTQANETDFTQLLYALGGHLDNKQAADFEISWAPDSVAIDYQTPKGTRERKDFTIEKLRHLALYSRFRKPNRSPPIRPAHKPPTAPRAK